MSSNPEQPRFFKMTFYKEVNAFEIYKYTDSSCNQIDNEFCFHEGTEWVFYWGDSIYIHWFPLELDKNHFLLFSPSLEYVPDSEYIPGRKSPVKGSPKTPLMYIEDGAKIEFVEGDNKVAHWQFDFYWGPSEGKMKSIDPESKVKETPH